MSVYSAAQTLSELSGGTLSQLPMQKILYVAHMVHLGRHGIPLFPEPFEAWDYGPVVRALYHATKRFDRNPIAPDQLAMQGFDRESREWNAVCEAWEIARDMSPGALVNYTHRAGGAWGMVYDPDRRGVVIPNEYIAREWEADLRASDETVDWARSVAAELETSPSDIWILRTSALSEKAYADTLSSNPPAREELAKVYDRLQTAPRTVGRCFRKDDGGLEHWAYDSPANVTARIRVYYTIDGRIVSIMAMGMA